ncbi:MAG TPA: serine hydrolase domain-containing protein [Longimicrobium sp.]|nr:serine hydrolase domain-containing protein [Longimicrobium sp.]
MSRIHISAALACILVAAPASTQPRTVTDVQALERYLARAEQLGFSGAVLVASGDRVLLERGYGWADRRNAVPVTAGTAFGIGSITKQFTATAILRLQEQGRLRVTDSIGRFLPGVPADKRGITLHHLLTHTAGLPREVEGLPQPGPTVPIPPADEYLRHILAAPLLWQPGTRHQYSNLGFRLLAMVVERASGMPYERFLREQLWLPAGMRQTGFALADFAPGGVARGYTLRDEGTALDRLLPPGAAGTAAHLGQGGLVSTAGDLFRWARALDDGRVLADSSRRALQTPHVAEDSTGRSHYGYGWVIATTARNTRLITHNGSDGVYFADLRRYVDEGVTVVFLTNQIDGLSEAVLAAIPRLVFGAPVDSLPGASAALAEVPARYAGAYRLPTGETLTLTHGGGRLEAPSTAPGVARHLLPLPPLQGDTAAALAGQTAVVRMMDDLLHGDTAATLRMLPPRYTAEEERAFWAEQLPVWARRFGAWRQTEPVGTTPNESGGWDHWLLIRFERGAAVVRVVQNQGTADIQTAPPPLLPAAFALAPAGDGELVVYNTQLRRTLRIQVERDPRGEPVALLIHTPRGVVRAPRLP